MISPNFWLKSFGSSLKQIPSYFVLGKSTQVKWQVVPSEVWSLGNLGPTQVPPSVPTASSLYKEKTEVLVPTISTIHW